MTLLMRFKALTAYFHRCVRNEVQSSLTLKYAVFFHVLFLFNVATNCVKVICY